jgi:hypothetical protein
MEAANAPVDGFELKEESGYLPPLDPRIDDEKKSVKDIENRSESERTASETIYVRVHSLVSSILVDVQ